ncbi:Casein kinase I [Symbiodinium microadriaticum]|uniref:Casein kinase I n=1 Tax=Symbiodinium microadriaticum TaxID=2951 RepID=A0A1Q9DFN8_SYMMI|nr:Casein kinase I [Symbiodinium microadriaticum]
MGTLCSSAVTAGEASGKAKVPPSLNNGQIQIQKKLGAGCFGEVYRGFHTGTKEDVAIKFEALQNQSLQLRHEGEMLNLLRLPTQPQGFAKFFFFGQEGNFNCLAMELLGKSLEDHVQLCGGKFSSKTACLVAQQVLTRIEYLHSRGVVHRDIKPENFMFGVGNKVHHLYLIDFGLSKRYWDKKHVPSTQKLSLTGTARYASLNAHRGFEQSRRDDLEAIGHMLLYFLRSSLPWSGLEARTKKEKYQKIKEKKESTELSDLCQGQREAFQAYLEYARNLGFKDRPDYGMLRKQFASLRAQLEREEGNPIQDWDFEWLQGKELGELEPLLPYDTLEQPDDEQAPSERPRGLCCFRCGGSQDRKKLRPPYRCQCRAQLSAPFPRPRPNPGGRLCRMSGTLFSTHRVEALAKCRS